MSTLGLVTLLVPTAIRKVAMWSCIWPLHRSAVVRCTSASGPMWGGALESSNPASVRSAIDMLVAMPGTRILVLGEMSGRIEKDEKDENDGMAELAAYAKHQGVDKLFAVGDQAELAARRFGAGARHFSDEDLLIAALNAALTADCALVVQGAHFMCRDFGVQTTAAGVVDVVGTKPKQV